MKIHSTKIAICLALSLACAVHAEANLALGSDPLALPFSPSIMPPLAGIQISSVHSETIFRNPLAGIPFLTLVKNGGSVNSPGADPTALKLNQIEIGQISSPAGLNLVAVNSDLGSFLTISKPADNPAISQVSFTPLSAVPSDLDKLGPQPLVLPEPNESSLLVIGLAVIALIFRFSPRKA